MVCKISAPISTGREGKNVDTERMAAEASGTSIPEDGKNYTKILLLRAFPYLLLIFLSMG